ncbi:flavodoxin domain-containing protein [Spirochaeta dissipatitropha]
MENTLIAYYSKTGSSEEAAGLICEELKAKGHSCSIRAISDIHSAADFEGFDSLIIGAPIHGMNWAEEGKTFLESYASELGSRKVYLYSVGYVMHSGRKFWHNVVTKGMDTLANQYGAAGTVHFKGRIDKQMPGAARLLFGISKQTPADIRDCQEVRDWARSIA